MQTLDSKFIQDEQKKKNNIPVNIDYPETNLWQEIDKVAKKYPNNVAVNYYGTKITYNELIAKIKQMAGMLQEKGINKGDTVSISSPNIPDAIIAFYAVNMIGAVSSMIYPLSSQGEFKHFLNFTNSKMLIVADVRDNNRGILKCVAKIIDETPVKTVLTMSPKDDMPTPIHKAVFHLKEGRKIEKAHHEKFVPMKKVLKECEAQSNPKVVLNQKDAVDNIIFSGGTLAEPKGIMLTNLNYNALAYQGATQTDQLEPGDKILAGMPIFHGFGLGILIHTALYIGTELIVTPNPKDIDSVVKLVSNEKIVMLAGVPSFLDAIFKHKVMRDADLSFLKIAVSGGDSLPEAIKDRINEFLEKHNSNVKVQEGYGLTETVTGCCLNPRLSIRNNSIGLAYPDTYMKVVKQGTAEELAPNEIGEICICGPTVMKGYLHNEKETSKTLKRHEDGNIWLHTGDAGCMDEDGYFYFKYRLKRIIITSGINVDPVHVENVIAKHPEVSAVGVIGKKHQYKGQEVQSYISLKNINLDHEKVVKEIYGICRENLSDKAIPTKIEIMQELPKTKVGKVNVRALEELANNSL